MRTGETAAVHALGVDVWQYRRSNPDAGAAFDAAMRSVTIGKIAAIVANHDFSQYPTIVDVGGGTGALLAAILDANPGSRGVLFDQAAVVAAAADMLTGNGLADRVEYVSGDFFGTVPSGADAYVLKEVLHDWDDDDASRILAAVRRAMSPTARVLLMEAVVGEPNQDPIGKFLDLQMLASNGGRERSDSEWRVLLEATGLTVTSLAPAGTVHIMVAEPAPGPAPDAAER